MTCPHTALAVACLGDRMASAEAINARLAEIERALQFDEDVERRRRVAAEYERLANLRDAA